jgi:hypothetical protein
LGFASAGEADTFTVADVWSASLALIGLGLKVRIPIPIRGLTFSGPEAVGWTVVALQDPGGPPNTVAENVARMLVLPAPTQIIVPPESTVATLVAVDDHKVTLLVTSKGPKLLLWQSLSISCGRKISPESPINDEKVVGDINVLLKLDGQGQLP